MNPYNVDHLKAEENLGNIKVLLIIDVMNVNVLKIKNTKNITWIIKKFDNVKEHINSKKNSRQCNEFTLSETLF